MNHESKKKSKRTKTLSTAPEYFFVLQQLLYNAGLI